MATCRQCENIIRDYGICESKKKRVKLDSETPCGSFANRPEAVVVRMVNGVLTTFDPYPADGCYQGEISDEQCRLIEAVQMDEFQARSDHNREAAAVQVSERKKGGCGKHA